MIRPLLIILIATLYASAMFGAPPKRDIKSIRREKQAVATEVKKTGQAITDNKRATERNLNRLNTLQRQMAESRMEIEASQTGIDSLDKAIGQRIDSLNLLTGRLDALRETYAAALKRQQLYPDVNSPFAFIFSASSVNEAYRRMRYLKEFDNWRSRRTKELSAAARNVTHAREALESSRNERAVALGNLKSQQNMLAREQSVTDSLVKVLRKEGSNLKAVLAEKQKRAEALDRELDRLIAEEQARAEAERKRKEAAAREAAAKKAEAEKKKKAEAAKKQQQPSTTTPSTTTPAPAPKEPPKSTSKKPLDSEAEADRQLTGSFEANKGRLLFPVAGRYRIVRGFGLQNHPELKHVKTNNSGIDIEVAPGTDARAIFAGHVSAIFRLPGYANIVMVRHGEYISLYANLASVAVSKGQEVKAGQTVGRILTASEEEGGATTFHFELRKERAKLNPLEWVK